MTAGPTRRRSVLAAVASSVAGAGCLTGRSTPTRTPECDRPAADLSGVVDDPPPCPTRPDRLRPCPTRRYALELERHLRYARAVDRYGRTASVEFGIEDATARSTGRGVLVHASLFFGGTVAGTPSGEGTPTPIHFDDSYAVSYLVTDAGQWRAVDRTGGDASDDPRRDGEPVSCPAPDGSADAPAVDVADFLLSPLAGTHPHVHRRAGTQYVVVGFDAGRDRATVADAATLVLDGDRMPLADRQPVPWTAETVEVAFTVSKGRSVDRGRVSLDGTTVRQLSASTVARLNAPPEFAVADPTVTPDSVRAGERTDATVRFALTNAGSGRGTFGASLGGNLTSGSETVTATVDAGVTREVTASVPVVGRGAAAAVRLDWGVDAHETAIPVIGETTGGGTPRPR